MAGTGTGGRSPGIAGAAIVGFVLGALTFVGSATWLAAGAGTTVDLVASVGLLIMLLLLMPTAVLLVRRDRRGQYLGVVAFGGVAVLNVLPALAGGEGGIPVLGVAVALGGALYLSLASEEFEDGAERAVPADEEDAVEGNPLR